MFASFRVYGFPCLKPYKNTPDEMRNALEKQDFLPIEYILVFFPKALTRS